MPNHVQHRLQITEHEGYRAGGPYDYPDEDEDGDEPPTSDSE